MWLQHGVGPKHQGNKQPVEIAPVLPSTVTKASFQTPLDRQVEELLAHARSMSSEGLLRLLGVAAEYAKMYPQEVRQTPESSA
jgi:hypothetical protein